jgi:hypothetical protein
MIRRSAPGAGQHFLPIHWWKIQFGLRNCVASPTAFAAGVDVKACEVEEIGSGLKLVILENLR